MNEQEKEAVKQKLREKFEAHLDAMAEEIGKFEGNPCAFTLYSMEKKVNAELDRFGDEISSDSFAGTHGGAELQDEAVANSKKNTGCTTGDGKPQSNSSMESQ